MVSQITGDSIVYLDGCSKGEPLVTGRFPSQRTSNAEPGTRKIFLFDDAIMGIFSYFRDMFHVLSESL